MSTLTYAALAARLTVASEAARSLAEQLRSACSRSDDGNTLPSFDLAETRQPSGRRTGNIALLAAKIEALVAIRIRSFSGKPEQS